MGLTSLYLEEGASNLHWLDILIIILYFVMVLTVGLWVRMIIQLKLKFMDALTIKEEHEYSQNVFTAEKNAKRYNDM